MLGALIPFAQGLIGAGATASPWVNVVKNFLGGQQQQGVGPGLGPQGQDLNPPSGLPDPNGGVGLGGGPGVLPPVSGNAPGQEARNTKAPDVFPLISGPTSTAKRPEAPPEWAPGRQQQTMPTNFMNFSGLLNNPNIFSRIGVGYNLGGLMGSLGAALTDMNENSEANRAFQHAKDDNRQYDIYRKQGRVL